MNYKRKICLFAIVGAIAISAMGLGYASWRTEITANGNVSANSQWDIVVTNADIRTSTGASYTEKEVDYELVRSGVKSDVSIAASICSGNWLDKEQESLIGTQDESAAMSATTHYYAIDTTKYDVTDPTTLDRTTVAADETTVKLSDYLNKYYSYAHGYENTDEQDGKYEEWKTLVMDGFLRDTSELLKENYPDTYQNYAVVSLVGYSAIYYNIAQFQSMSGSAAATISEDKTTVNYADVSFSLPGAWAEFTLTVKNQGSVDANLSDAIIELTTESDQLTLTKPELENEVLKAGESCEITFVVQVPDTVTDNLDASGTLTVKLPYSQVTVEDAPGVNHTHR